ncbi:MAG TPA: PfaD family polyunsaturated fatty acid/polyketide biosynthesis protein, partial [Gemmataceae bacterium]|nr:PfaD family polyunsaturated fatty acid/polyketide biosynthesis protein [Gemmataceae bacterium]
LVPASLGDSSFCADHGLRFPYVTGAMANGIASAEVVEAVASAGMLAFFGAAGLSLDRTEAAIVRLKQNLGDRPYGFNLIHSPGEQSIESATVDLYLRHGVRLAEASAYLDLTPHVVRYRLSGIHRGPDGRVVTPNRVVAKVSRVEVATKFFAPPPEKFVRELVQQRVLSPEQAELAKLVPVAQDVTVEADSGGHTDNRPAVTLLPTILALRDRLQVEHDYPVPLRVGLGGGIATPAGAAAAFAMGAAYILTGSVNQACVESGSSDLVRQMLADAGQADVAMAPAADMFEMGVKVQVLKRGTMFPMRAAKLYELYRAYSSLDAIPEAERASLEKNVFRLPFAEVWAQTRDFFLRRDPSQVPKAEADPKHKMALVFRWYLGQSSRWANAGVPDRKLDYQVWCGPSMGAFNEWAKGSFLEQSKNRTVVTVALNLLYGAAVALRRNSLRSQGVNLDGLFPHGPLQRDELEQRLGMSIRPD